jgi:hypothetical protein
LHYAVPIDSLRTRIVIERGLDNAVQSLFIAIGTSDIGVLILVIFSILYSYALSIYLLPSSLGVLAYTQTLLCYLAIKGRSSLG